jgi:hypothetical protein
MRSWRIIVVTLPALLSVLSAGALASQFVVFPKTTDLLSPDGRFACAVPTVQPEIRFRWHLPLALAFRCIDWTVPQTLLLPWCRLRPHSPAMIGS